MAKYTDWQVQELKKEHKNYPTNFSRLSDAPGKLYVRGELDLLSSEKTIAVVGSRRMSRYAQDVVGTFMSAFASTGITVVSGFMYGVDTEAHTQILNFKGRTIAILGAGINQCYPPENEELYTEILDNGGAVLSEYEPEAKPKPWMFVKRNRLIAAIANVGVLVIEAAENSGTLITANCALKLGTPLFSVPGPVTSVNAKGVNNLIKSGAAKMVTTPADILGHSFSNGSAKKNKHNALTSNILELLNIEPLSADEISIRLNMSVVEVLSEMSELLIGGQAIEIGGRYQAS